MSVTDSNSGLDDEQLETIYGWVDEVPLSRPKKSISRDFADGVLVAEMIAYYFPKLVELHNYTPSNSTSGKRNNWLQLNRRVLTKLDRFELADDVISDLISAKGFTIEKLLIDLKYRIDAKLAKDRLPAPPPVSSFRAKENDQPEADQYIGKGRGNKNHKKGQQTKSHTEVVPPPFERINYKSLARNNLNLPASLPRRAAGGSNKDGSDLALKYEEKEQECLVKGETIAMLQAKCRRLEHLIHLKDIRLDELQTQIEQLRPTGGLKG